MGKKAKGGKDDRRGHNRERSKRQHKTLDQREVQSAARSLLLEGLELKEVQRDGNCFFRSLADQLEGLEHSHDEYRQKILSYVERHEDEFAPFMSFGESEEEEDADFCAYLERMKSDGEWAGQVELIAASQALNVNIVVHQFDNPTYRIESRSSSGRARDVHVSYHDGEHYNSVRPIGSRGAAGHRTAAAAEPSTGAVDGVVSNSSIRSSSRTLISGDASEGEGAEVVTPSADDLERLTADVSRLEVTDADDGNDERAARATGDGVADLAEEDVEAPREGTKASKQRDKARKKEEKRLKKEQKHREAIAAAGGERTDATEASGGETSCGHAVITL